MPNYGLGIGVGLGLRAYKSTPSAVNRNYLSGFVQSIYTGYFSDNVNWFSTATRSSSAVVTTLNNSSVPTTTSYQTIGYFVPSTTETYTLYLASDDASYLWIGNNAVSGFTTANANINNGGSHATNKLSANVGLVAGNYYPIRIQNGNNGGPGVVIFSYSTPTITETTNLNGVVYYNSATNGI
jgi:hypothetical protein